MIESLPFGVDGLAFDMPGHGRSPMPEQIGDFHAQVATIVGDLVTRPSLMVGHSFGAASMLRHALHHPETVTGLVLIEPVFFAVARGEPEFDPYVEQEKPLHDAVMGADLEAAARAFLALNPGSPDFDALPPQAQAMMAAQMRLVTATLDGLFGDSGGLLEPGVMEGFDKPVLLMLGSGTTPIFHATVRRLAQCLPRAEVVTIAGAGHMVPISHATQTAAAIGDWAGRNGLAQ
ncbi:MAG: alpha/beta hydrolase [Paracoccaceae bacterium]